MQEKINFISTLEYAEKIIFCFCIDVYEIFDGDDIEKLFVRLTRIKNSKFNFKNQLVEKNTCTDKFSNKTAFQRRQKVFLKLDMIIYFQRKGWHI